LVQKYFELQKYEKHLFLALMALTSYFGLSEDIGVIVEL